MLKTVCIDHINMVVKDLDESVRFYSELFGFVVMKEQPEQDSVIIGDENVKLCIYEGDSAGDRNGISHFGIHVSNFDEVLEICKRLSVPVMYDGVLDWEKSRSIYIQDPNGYEIELSEVEGGGL